nr:hypothetical protein CFP56_20206 [Quercus suber]
MAGTFFVQDRRAGSGPHLYCKMFRSRTISSFFTAMPPLLVESGWVTLHSQNAEDFQNDIYSSRGISDLFWRDGNGNDDAQIGPFLLRYRIEFILSRAEARGLRGSLELAIHFTCLYVTLLRRSRASTRQSEFSLERSWLG